MVSVVIPVLNEEATIASVVEFALSEPLVDHVIVVDDASIDATAKRAAEAGAKVIQSTLLGKGASMHDGVIAARGGCIIFLDGDLRGLRPGLVEKLATPVLDGTADFVKAGFTRKAGRVTLLTVKPLMQVFFPELCRFTQPIGGIFASRRELLLQLDFESDYGVDVGLLIDASLRGEKVIEVDVGALDHDSQDLHSLGVMACQVVRVILDRAAASERLKPQALAEMRETERHILAGLESQAWLHHGPRPIVLLPVDEVVLQGELIHQLGLHLGCSQALHKLEDLPADETERLHFIAGAFYGTPLKDIQTSARLLPLNPEALGTVRELRRLGYRVGIIGELFHAAVEILRRRVYADLSFAHITRRFDSDFRTGDLMLSPAFTHPNGCTLHSVCSGNVVHHVREHYGLNDHDVIAAGMWPRDACLLSHAGQGYSFNTPYAEQHGLAGDLSGSLARLPTLCSSGASPQRMSAAGGN